MNLSLVEIKWRLKRFTIKYRTNLIFEATVLEINKSFKMNFRISFKNVITMYMN